MTEVEIEYCVPCGHRDNAQEVQTAVLEEFGQEVDRVALKTGDSGVFKVRVDGDIVFDKADEEFSVEGIVDSVRRAHVSAA